MQGDLEWDSRVKTTAKEKRLVGTAQARVTGRVGQEQKGHQWGETGCYQGISMTLRPVGTG